MRRLSHCLAAPTGKAAKRMSEKTGITASTIHKLLNYNPFLPEKIKNEKEPIVTDVLIIDELSMVDIDIMGALTRVVMNNTMVIFVGDADQLFSIGPGNVLGDLISSKILPVVKLERAYRQKGKNSIYENGVRINKGQLKLELDPREFIFRSLQRVQIEIERVARGE
jgi:exodeoxyribonuclease V alpha subunit